MSDQLRASASVTILSDYRMLRDLAQQDSSPTGCSALSPCDDATGNSRPDPDPSGSGRLSLRVGDDVFDSLTRCVSRITMIDYGPHGAPAQVRIVRCNAPAGTLGHWRRADKVGKYPAMNYQIEGAVIARFDASGARLRGELGPHPQGDDEAMMRLLKRAFEDGRRAKAAEMRETLGLA